MYVYYLLALVNCADPGPVKGNIPVAAIAEAP